MAEGLGPHFGSCCLILGISFDVFSHFQPSCIVATIFTLFFSHFSFIFGSFGKVWGGLGNDFSFIFGMIFEKGDVVKIIESKPISKLKTWEVIDK